MIDRPTDSEKHLIYRVLVHAINSNSGIGFSHNADQGHPFYRLGADGNMPADAVDTPETSELFKLLVSFDSVFHEEIEDLSTWEKYCKFAVAAYDRANAPPPR